MKRIGYALINPEDNELVAYDWNVAAIFASQKAAKRMRPPKMFQVVECTITWNPKKPL